MVTKATTKPTRAAKPKAKTPKATLKFGRPGTAGKAEGDEAVRAWIKGVKPEHRPIVERLDALVGEVVPDVKRAVKWSSPMYGLPGIGWFASMASFKDHINLSFFAGANLDPPPPLGESKAMRRVTLESMGDFDEKRFRSWVKQASSMKGWGSV